MSNLVRIKIYGVNISRLYKLLKKNEIEMFNIDREDYKTLYFDIKHTDTKKLFALLQNSCYNVSIAEKKGVIKFIDFLTKKLGYVIGTVIFCVVLIISSFYVSDIKIYGNNKIESKALLQTLSEINIKKGSMIGSIDTEVIKQKLLSTYPDISLISVIKKGTNIVINIKERQTNDFLENQ